MMMLNGNSAGSLFANLPTFSVAALTFWPDERWCGSACSMEGRENKVSKRVDRDREGQLTAGCRGGRADIAVV